MSRVERRGQGLDSPRPNLFLKAKMDKKREKKLFSLYSVPVWCESADDLDGHGPRNIKFRSKYSSSVYSGNVMQWWSCILKVV